MFWLRESSTEDIQIEANIIDIVSCGRVVRMWSRDRVLAMCVYTVSAREVRNLIRDVVRSRVKRDNATCNDNNKRTLLGINRILGMGEMQYDVTQCKSASPGGVFTGCNTWELRK